MIEKMNAHSNAFNWFEIPMTDTERARKFYEGVFDIELKLVEMMGYEMLFFPSSDNMEGKVSGALVKGKTHKPSKEGLVLYLNANPDIQVIIDRISAHGGQIRMPRTLINEQVGYMATFVDSEGNYLALHGAK